MTLQKENKKKKPKRKTKSRKRERNKEERKKKKKSYPFSKYLLNEWLNWEVQSVPHCLFHSRPHTQGLTFWIWATSAALPLKQCSDASGSERLLREPALLLNTGVGSVPAGSYCWLEGHFPFNTTWQILSRRLIITRSYKEDQKFWGVSTKLPKFTKSLEIMCHVF